MRPIQYVIIFLIFYIFFSSYETKNPRDENFEKFQSLKEKLVKKQYTHYYFMQKFLTGNFPVQYLNCFNFKNLDHEDATMFFNTAVDYKRVDVINKIVEIYNNKLYFYKFDFNEILLKKIDFFSPNFVDNNIDEIWNNVNKRRHGRIEAVKYLMIFHGKATYKQ